MLTSEQWSTMPTVIFCDGERAEPGHAAAFRNSIARHSLLRCRTSPVVSPYVGFAVKVVAHFAKERDITRRYITGSEDIHNHSTRTRCP